MVFKTAPVTVPSFSGTSAQFLPVDPLSVTLAANQTVELTLVLQFLNTASGHNIAATVGRGTTPVLSTSYTNLANGVAFSSTDL